jgi:hypothetical protein
MEKLNNDLSKYRKYNYKLEKEKNNRHPLIASKWMVRAKRNFDVIVDTSYCM